MPARRFDERRPYYPGESLAPQPASAPNANVRSGFGMLNGDVWHYRLRSSVYGYSALCDCVFGVIGPAVWPSDS